jgi:uncharacterized phage-like protein YoqJ
VIICGTGHRPDKLGGYTDEVFLGLVSLARSYICDVRTKTDEGKDIRIISGGALGWDQALAEAAWREGVPYTLALPFPGFEDRWPDKSKKYLAGLMFRSQRTHFVCESGYAGWKMQERNKWMVDNSDAVLALWNGSPGGTSNCVKYAEKVKKPVINLWETYERQR